MAATQWNDSLRITDIFHLCQMLATIMVYVDSDDALPEPLVTTLVGKTAEWHQLCQNAGFDVDPLDLHNPRNAIERAEKLLRRDPSWVADGRRVKVHIEQKMRRCNFPLCPVPHVEGTQNLKQCSRCKAARYVRCLLSTRHVDSHVRFFSAQTSILELMYVHFSTIHTMFSSYTYSGKLIRSIVIHQRGYEIMLPDSPLESFRLPFRL